MRIHKAIKLKLYPNKEQEKHLIETINACRFVWNYYLAKRKEEYLNGNKSFNYYKCAKDLTILKKSDDFKWISNSQIHPLQQSLRNLDIAYTRFFKKKSKYPIFKSKNDPIKSFQKPRDWKIIGNKIQIEKWVAIRFRGTLPSSECKLGAITVVSQNGKWYASIKYTEDVTVKKKAGNPIGIDMGLTHLAITSEGDKYVNIRSFRKSEKKLAEAQRVLSRKTKGSSRRNKQKVVVATIHEKIKNRRINHLHQTSHRITSENQAVIVCEDLAVKNMLKNRKLSKAISDAGWGEFLRQLEYKQIWRGGEFVKVDRLFPSSKTCSNCNHIVEKLPLNIREWTCPKCEAIHDRDVNAAKMILKQGLRNSRYAEDSKTKRKRGKSVEARR